MHHFADRIHSRPVGLLPLMVVALAVSTSGVAAQEEQTTPKEPTAPVAVEHPRLPDALRNPRLLRQEQGVSEGPRMVAGGLSIEGDGGIASLARLESIVGEFTFEGIQWIRAESDATPFDGTWTNQWLLDGQYLQSSFTVNDGDSRPYEVIGMMWYDDNEQRFEATYYNSNNSLQTIRWGNFDDAGVTDESPPEDEPTSPVQERTDNNGTEAKGSRLPVLSMLARSNAQPEDAEPTARYELVIVDVNEFKYIGYIRSRETGEFRKAFEMTMTRKVPITLEGG